MKHVLLLGAAALALSGCTLDPYYTRPGMPTSSTYPSTGAAYRSDQEHDPASSAGTTAAAFIGWRQVFTDPRLQALISLSLENNRDLRVTVLNIAASQAQFRLTRSALFPTIDATVDASLEGSPTSAAEPNIIGVPTGHVYSHSYDSNLGFTAYELDLFGKIRSQTRAQFETYLSNVDTRRSTQISLVAEVASDYITMLADHEQLKLAEQTLQSQSKTYGLSQAQFAEGTTTLLTLREAETTVDTAKASVAQFTRQVAQDENALVLVVGAPLPDNLPPGRDLVNQEIMANLPAGIPSSLLEQRPDIMAAEHTLLAANASIGAARAAFFPSISLTGAGGVSSFYLRNLFSPAAAAWSFAPQITLPIFTGGENRANLDYAKVEKRIEIANYEQTIQTAFSEVADGLAARGTYLDQLAAEQQLVNAYSDSYRLAYMRFKAGVDSFLTSLTTQQSLFDSQQTLVTLKEDQLQNLVTLYKALGGGWYETTPSSTATMGVGQL
jgi:multidrug efflux system outer membrane protein